MDETQYVEDRPEVPKRRDSNKSTPGDILAYKAKKRSDTWQTPDYLEQIASQSAWNENSPQQGITLGMTTPNTKGSNETMSESEDEDNIKLGSGNESINKSLADTMEAEAGKKQHD